MANTGAVKVVNVTPAMAQKWLGRNTNNRTISKRHVAFLLGVIERGEWALSNDAICFAPDGTLLNGQHRLTAIAESGKTLPLAVMENVSRGTQLAMDTGKKRMAHEQMEIMGVHGGRAKAALCRAILNYDDAEGLTNRYDAISNAEVISLAEGDQLMDQAISLAQALGRQIPGARVAMVYLAYYLLLAAWPEKVDTFHEMLMRGTGLDETSPVYRLRQHLIQGSVRQKGHSDRRKLLAMFLKAFNYWIDGRELEVLVWRSNDDWPVPFTKASYQRMLAGRARGEASHATRLRRAAEAASKAG